MPVGLLPTASLVVLRLSGLPVPRQYRTLYGSNLMPEPPSKTWLQLFLDVFEDDPTVWILMASSLVSLVIGIYEDPSSGWIEGVAILSAVLIVAVVTACNDYQSQAQFIKLNKQAPVPAWKRKHEEIGYPCITLAQKLMTRP